MASANNRTRMQKRPNYSVRVVRFIPDQASICGSTMRRSITIPRRRPKKSTPQNMRWALSQTNLRDPSTVRLAQRTRKRHTRRDGSIGARPPKGEASANSRPFGLPTGRAGNGAAGWLLTQPSCLARPGTYRIHCGGGNYLLVRSDVGEVPCREPLRRQLSPRRDAAVGTAVIHTHSNRALIDTEGLRRQHAGYFA